MRSKMSSHAHNVFSQPAVIDWHRHLTHSTKARTSNLPSSCLINDFFKHDKKQLASGDSQELGPNVLSRVPRVGAICTLAQLLFGWQKGQEARDRILARQRRKESGTFQV